MKQWLEMIMKLAPLGLVPTLLTKSASSVRNSWVYMHPLALYYLACTAYFVVFFSLYAYLAAGSLGFLLFGATISPQH